MIVADMGLRVNIIGKSNGVGLDRDVRLLSAAFAAADCDVTYTRTASRQSGRRKSSLFRTFWRLRDWLFPNHEPRYDLNVMLEHVWTQYRHDARTNALIPNPDFFDRHDLKALPLVDCVWTKTVQAQQIFRGLHSNVHHIGFDSEDRLDASVRRQHSFFHLAGSSVLKGTQRLLTIWAAHPEWPVLVVAGRLKFKPPVASNIRIHDGYLEDQALRRLQNESRIHICTSEAEGWGHYLVEAMSVGAAVITVDAPPMNILISPDRGWLLPCLEHGQQRLIPRYLFDEQALTTLINQLALESEDSVDDKGRAGRQWYEKNRAEFPPRIKQALLRIVGGNDNRADV